MTRPLSLAVLISGNGSNLQAIIDAIEAGRLRAEIKTVVSSNPEAYGLQRASQHNIQSRVIDAKDYQSRDDYDDALRQYLQQIDPDYIVLAGFMRILTPGFIEAFEHRILNIHPSLLPAYRGLNTYQRALDNAETQHGVSIHLVTAELDAGPIILQSSYPVAAGDGVEDLQAKGHQLEHLMYPQVLSWLSDHTLTIKQGQIYYEQALLEQPIRFDR
jgi:phosphoribosylglycinamide formyltransferase-1